MAATNHQPVRNWVDRRTGRAPALPSDPIPGKIKDDNDNKDGSGDDEGEDEYVEGEDRYVICVEQCLDPEEAPEGGWTANELHGPGDWSSGRDTSSSDSTGMQERRENTTVEQDDTSSVV